MPWHQACKVVNTKRTLNDTKLSQIALNESECPCALRNVRFAIVVMLTQVGQRAKKCE